ncbi:DUF1990 domain-containing protein [Kitasatospora sp. NPDC002040]|uniref:DUF1990 family protein n=1 Tax=Kitasatospora sp. NPDC002040 TaxID=3154661 RepID=UPI00331B2B9B
MSTLNYPEVGATADPAHLPRGYNHLHHRVLLGHGRDVLEAAGRAVTGWQMHRGTGIRVAVDAERAEPGVRLVCAIGLGPVRIGAPAEVVWSVYQPDRIGFAYGTGAGHPARGEESFVVEMGPDKAVWFTVTAFSRPDRWYTRLGGPLLPALQAQYVRYCGRVVRRLASAPDRAT